MESWDCNDNLNFQSFSLKQGAINEAVAQFWTNFYNEDSTLVTQPKLWENGLKNPKVIVILE